MYKVHISYQFIQGTIKLDHLMISALTAYDAGMMALKRFPSARILKIVRVHSHKEAV